MMKTKIFKTTKALLISLAVLFTAGCSEVGLGSAVDTAAPTVEIAYPPKNAIVRDSFIVSGTCDDDLFVSSVEVTVTNTSTKEVYGPYKATINLERTEWSVLLNQKNRIQSLNKVFVGVRITILTLQETILPITAACLDGNANIIQIFLD